MKKILLLFVLANVIMSISAQDSIKIESNNTINKTVGSLPDSLDSEDDQPVFLIVEENATFEDGDLNKFRTWVQQNLRYPIEAVKAKKQGKVIIQFTINSKGFVVSPKVIIGVDPFIDNEAIRCINSLPKWKPAKQEGKIVKQMFTIPIVFSL
jgi:protein TonB